MLNMRTLISFFLSGFEVHRVKIANIARTSSKIKTPCFIFYLCAVLLRGTHESVLRYDDVVTAIEMVDRCRSLLFSLEAPLLRSIDRFPRMHFVYLDNLLLLLFFRCLLVVQHNIATMKITLLSMTVIGMQRIVANGSNHIDANEKMQIQKSCTNKRHNELYDIADELEKLSTSGEFQFQEFKSLFFTLYGQI